MQKNCQKWQGMRHREENLEENYSKHRPHVSNTDRVVPMFLT